VLLPSFGVRATIWIAAAINLLIGVGAIVIDLKLATDKKGSEPEQSAAPAVAADGDQASHTTSQIFWLSCAFVSGFVTFSVQVTWSRLLAMIIGSSTYALSIVVALFLLGLAIGAYLVSRAKLWAGDDRDNPHSKLRRAVFRIEILTAAALVVSIWLTNIIPALLVVVGFKLGVNSWVGLLALQIFAATLLVLVPAVLMGMVMPLVLVWAASHRPNAMARSSDSQTMTSAVGRSYAINTVGAIAGSVATAVVLIPVTGSRVTVMFAASLCLFVASVAYLPKQEKVDRAVVRALSAGTAAVLVFFMLAVGPRFDAAILSVGAYDSYVRVLAKSRGDTPENNKGEAEDHTVLMYKEGTTATVSVRRDWGVISLAINGRTNASDTGDMPTQVMLGQLGVLTAPRLDNALIVGFATGVTAGSMLQSQIQSVECIEIERAAVASSHYFDHVNNHPLSDPRTRLMIDDARTYLRVNPARYDIIVSEPSHPWVPGVANLFTREFFTLGRERLRDDGVFVQWLQIYQLSTESLRSVMATFHETFPHVLIFRVRGEAKGKDLILVGSRMPVSLDRIAERMSNPRVAADLNRVGIKTADDVRAWFVCDETQLGPAVAGAIINTDDNMHVETMAPREAFRPLMEENAAWIESLGKTLPLREP
jgi:spermidine synthase